MTRSLFAFLTVLGCLLGLLAALRLTDQLHPYRVPSAGMQPTLQPGDCICTQRWSYWSRSPRRGEIVVFVTSGISRIRQPDPPAASPVYIQRVVAISGDTLEVRHSHLFVNGEDSGEAAFLRLPAGSHTSGYEQSGEKLTVPPSCCFVLGDNRDHSFDSRYWGFLPAGNVRGRAWLRYWPFSRVGFF